jgi:integrase
MASITETKAGTHRALIRRKGHKTICKTFKTHAEAVRWSRSAEAAIDAGRAPSAPDGATVGHAIQAYQELREMGARPIVAGSNEVYMLRNLERFLGDDRVAELTPRRIAQYCQRRREDGAGGYTIGMEVSKLGTALKFARLTINEDWGDPITQARPLLDHLGLIGVESPRDRVASEEEETRLRAEMPPLMRDIFDFAKQTCMRRSEIVKMKREHIDAERRLLTIPDRKHPRQRQGNTDVIPLLGDALEIVQRQPKEGEYVFPVSAEWISDNFLLACKIAKIQNLRFHDTRALGITRLFERGATVEMVAKVSGHKSWEILKRYARLRPEEVGERLNALPPILVRETP